MGLNLGTIQLENDKKNYKNVNGLRINTQKNNSIEKGKKWYQEILQKPKAFDDGYQFGDITKTTVSTIADAPLNIAKGVSSIGDAAAKVAVGGIAKVADWTGHDEYANLLRNRLAGNDEKVNERLSKYTPTGILNEASGKVDPNSVIGNTLDEINQGVGYYGGMLAAQSVGVPWQATAGVTSAGNELSEAYANGANDAQAWLSAGISAGVEIGTEYLFGGVKLPGTGKTTEGIISKVTDKISNKGLKYLLQSGFQIGGEGAEEVLSGLGSAIGKKLTYMSDKELNEIYSNEDKLKDFVIGAAVSGITMGANPNTYNNIKTGRSLITGLTVEEANKVDNIVNNIEQQEKRKLSNSEIEEIQQQVINSSNENSMQNLTNYNETIQQRNNIEQQEELNNQVNNMQKQINEVNENLENIKIQTSKQNIIDDKVNEYIKNQKLNFNSDINIDSSVISENNLPINYKNEKQATLYKKARDLFSKIGKKKFNNKADTIYVDNSDIKESIEKTLKNPAQKDLVKENLAVFSQLDKIIERGTELSFSKLDNKNRTEYSDYKYYVSNALIDNRPFVVEFDTRLENKNNNKERHFRLERVYPIEKDGSATGASKKLPNRFGTEPSRVNNIPHNNENINTNGISNNYSMRNNKNNVNKILNPIEISNLKQSDTSSTPILPSRNVETGNGESKFADNILYKTDMLNDESKKNILSSDEVKYYQEVTNKESLDKAFDRLSKDKAAETLRWLTQDTTKSTSVDVAEGWILLKQYQDQIVSEKNLLKKDELNRSMVEIAKHLRDIGTKAGQTVQAFNIMNRLTPEGMAYYAQSELSEAFEKFCKNKTKEWIDFNRKNFEITPEETQFIMDTMEKVQSMEDGYDKRVQLALIQKMLTDKLPPDKGNAVKSWMRISMLFNPKTQVRNVAGNAMIVPINAFGDLFASAIDKRIAKKTGIRTTGKMNLKNYLQGSKRGIYEATNDYKLGINTKDMDGNRFEIKEGKSFSNKNIFGKTANKVNDLLSYVLDVGDRAFSEGSFQNSLQNQLILNNTTEVTQDMIDIATQEALSRTWNDNNEYTRFVINARNGLNKLAHIGEYGLGDVLIPFAKTPANLTKAIVDYSPIGLVNALKEGNNLKKSLSNGQYDAKMQHKFVQDLGKATAGSMLYILGIALAKAGISSGKSDDDKDTANFLKNTLGINSYSIKIGNKTFTYDWAQPLAAPLSVTANVVTSKNKGAALLESVVNSLDTGGSILLEQSFMQSINDVLTNNDGVVSGLLNEVLELPSRAIPTLSKQIVDLTDSTQRTSYEYGKPLESAVNSIKAKLPGLSKTLAPSVDTMGREIQRYGGKNNLFNVFINPANVNTENISESAKEIYRLYKKTGQKDIMPRVAPYYIGKSEKVILNSTQKAEYQKVSGKIIEDNVSKLINNNIYKNLSDVEKAEVINNIVNYSYNVAQKEILNLDISSAYEKAYLYSKIGNLNDYYLLKEQKIEGDKNTEGKTINGSKKNNVINYINSMNMTIPEKAILIKMYGNFTFNDYNSQIVDYVNSKKLTVDEKQKILEELDFTIRDGRVYW